MHISDHQHAADPAVLQNKTQNLAFFTPLLSVSSQVKAAFTRTYNKDVHLTPYSLQVVSKGRRGGGGGGGGGESELGGEEVDNEAQQSEEEGDGLKTDAMIKVRALKCANPLHILLSYLSVFLNVVCVFFCAAKEGQSHQGVKEREEGRFWEGEGEGQRKGQRQGREMTDDHRRRTNCRLSPPQTLMSFSATIL